MAKITTSKEPESFVVQGRVRQAKRRRSLPGMVVRAYDQGLRRAQLLGEAITDRRGDYEIPYTADQLRRAEKRSADLVVRVFDSEGQELAASEIYFNAPQVAEIDLVVTPREAPEPSEYERLVAALRPILEDVQLAELTEADVDFLV